MVEVDDFWAMNSEDIGLIVCAISFQDFQFQYFFSFYISGNSKGVNDDFHFQNDGQATALSFRAVWSVFFMSCNFDGSSFSVDPMAQLLPHNKFIRQPLPHTVSYW